MSTPCEGCGEIDKMVISDGQLVCRCRLVQTERIIDEGYEPYKGIERMGPPEKPEQEREPGTTLKENERKKIIKVYQKRTKIGRNIYRIQIYLESAYLSSNLIVTTKSLNKKMAPNKNMQGRNYYHIILLCIA